MSFVYAQVIKFSFSSDARESSESKQLEYIALGIREVKDMCQLLMKRQIAFEQELSSRLDQCSPV